MNTKTQFEELEQQQREIELEQQIKELLKYEMKYIDRIFVNLSKDVEFVIIVFKQQGSAILFDTDIDILKELGLKLSAIDFENKKAHFDIIKELA